MPIPTKMLECIEDIWREEKSQFERLWRAGQCSRDLRDRRRVQM